MNGRKTSKYDPIRQWAWTVGVLSEWGYDWNTHYYCGRRPGIEPRTFPTLVGRLSLNHLTDGVWIPIVLQLPKFHYAPALRTNTKYRHRHKTVMQPNPTTIDRGNSAATTSLTTL